MTNFTEFPQQRSDALAWLASAASDLLQRIADEGPAPAEPQTEFETARPEVATSEAPLWAQALADQCREARDELRFLAGRAVESVSRPEDLVVVLSHDGARDGNVANNFEEPDVLFHAWRRGRILARDEQHGAGLKRVLGTDVARPEPNTNSGAIAAMTSSSSAGSIVRGSRTSRSSRTRATTAGEPCRSLASSASADRYASRIDTRRVGNADPGALPPPMVDSPSTTSARTPGRAPQALASDAARADRSSIGIAIIRATGTVSRARPPRCSRSVASSAA